MLDYENSMKNKSYIQHYSYIKYVNKIILKLTVIKWNKVIGKNYIV